jgi:peptide/nickel transport system substrate-binding protein
MTQDIVEWTGQPPYQGWGADAVFDALTQCNEKGEPEPSIAEKWEISDDQKSVTANLRPGVKFTDGTPVDSAAVKASYEFIAKKNARFADTKIETPDPQTVTITWPTPQPVMALKLCEGTIFSPTWLKSGNTNDVPVGSGPYKYDPAASTRGSTYTFTKVPSHWDAATYPYQKLVLKVFKSETAGLNALKTGQIDGILATQATVDEAKSSGQEIVTLRGNTTRLLITDHLGKKIPALGNLKVRQAMNMAIDKNAVAEQLYRGKADPAVQIFRPGSSAYIEDLQDPYPYNLEKAKQLMSEAGFANGFTLEIPHLEGQNLDVLIPYVAEQLGKLNIKVKQANLSGPNAITELLSAKYPVPLWQLGNYGESLQDIQDYVLQDGIWNVSHQEDATVEGLWDEILAAKSPEERVEPQQKLNQYIVEQAWFVPMAYPDGFYAHSPDVKVPKVSDFAALHPLLRDFK